MAPLSLKQENQSAFKVCESVRVHLIKHVSSWWIFHHSWHLLLFASRKSHGIHRRADLKGKSPGVEGGRDMQHVSDPNCWNIRQQTSICQQSENEMENDSKRQQKEEHTEGGLSDKARNGMRQCNNLIKTRNSLSDKHLERAFIWVCRFVMFTQTISVYSLNDDFCLELDVQHLRVEVPAILGWLESHHIRINSQTSLNHHQVLTVSDYI